MTVTNIIPRHTVDSGKLSNIKICLTEDHHMVMTGFCSVCNQEIAVAIMLTELHDSCPGPIDYGTEDLAMLHSLGVCIQVSPLLISS